MGKMKTLWTAIALALSAQVGWAVGPTITNLGVTATTNSTATIQWTTNVPTTSQVWYGATSPDGSTPMDPTLVTSHTVIIPNLVGEVNTSYYASSTNAGGETTTSATQKFELCDNASEELKNVSGTVNNYYEYGNYTITWVNLSGRSIAPTVCGVPVPTTITGTLDKGGTVTAQIYDNPAIVPSPSTYQIAVTGVDGSIGAFTTLIPITGGETSLDISATLAAAAAGNLLHVWYDPATGAFYPSTGGGAINVTGCGLTGATGKAYTGKFVSGTTGTCTVTITPGPTATTGFFCKANNLTTPANVFVQTATNTTTATMVGATTTSDVINFSCDPNSY